MQEFVEAGKEQPALLSPTSLNAATEWNMGDDEYKQDAAGMWKHFAVVLARIPSNEADQITVWVLPVLLSVRRPFILPSTDAS